MNAFSPDVAIHYLERAREDLASMPGDHRLEEADVLKEIGEQHSGMGDNAKADEFYGESLKKLPEEDVTMRALLLLSRADAVRMMDQLTLTRKYCEEAIPLLDKVGHRRGLALTHRILAQTAFKEGRYDVAREEIEGTMGLLDPHKNAKDLAICYIDLGNVYSEGGYPGGVEKAIEFYRKAITTLETINDYRQLARAHNNLAITLMPDHPHEAKAEIKQAQSYSEKAKDRRGTGWRLFNSVDICLALGEIDEAVRDNEEAGRILSVLNDPFGVQQVTLNKGIIAQHRKSYEESEKAYINSLKRAESLGYPPVVVETLIHMALMYVDWGKMDEATKAMSKIKEVGGDHISPTYLPSYEKLKKQLGL
jgi:tetratricopeptide (TPR) repeat protein